MIAFLLASIMAAEPERPTATLVADNVAKSFSDYATKHPQMTTAEMIAYLEKQSDEMQHDLEHSRATLGGDEAEVAIRSLTRRLATVKQELSKAKKPNYVPPKPERRLDNFDFVHSVIGDVGRFHPGPMQDDGWVWSAYYKRVLASSSVLVWVDGEKYSRIGGHDLSTHPRFILRGPSTKGIVAGSKMKESPVDLVFIGFSEEAGYQRIRIYEVFDPDKPFK